MACVILILGSCQESSVCMEGCMEGLQDSSSEIISINHSNTVKDGVIARLEAYNDSLLLISESPSSLKGILSKQYVNVAVKDFFGFWEGAAIGITIGGLAGPEGAAAGGLLMGTLFGAYQSYKAADAITRAYPISFEDCLSAYIKMKEEISDYSDYYPTTLSLSLPEGKQDLQLSGAQHNLVLDNLQKRNFSNTSLEDAYENGTITENEYNILSSTVTKTFFTNIGSGLRVSTSVLGELPNKIIELYKGVILNSSSSYHDVEYTSNKYISEIFSTIELDSTEKDNVTFAICVMTSSVEYWKPFEPQR